MMSLPDFRYKQCIFYFSSKEKCSLHFKADNILIKNEENNKTVLQHSCHKTFALFIIGNITLTNVVLKKAKQFGFPVILLSHNFKLECYFNNRAEGNFLLRQKQYNANKKNLLIAKKLVSLKLKNQIALLKNLRYKAKEEKETIIQLERCLPDKAGNSKELMGIEGNAGKLFFSVYFRHMNWIRRSQEQNGM